MIDIVLPIYHERDNITTLLTRINKVVITKHRLILVLQDKKDPTLIAIKKLQKKYPNISLHFTPNGVGLGKAIRTGLKLSKSTIVIVMMSDLSDDPKDIDKMVLKLESGYDLVCGCRNIKGGKRIGTPRPKGDLSFLASKSLHYLRGIPTHDATNAFKGYKRELLDKINIESLEGYEMSLEITIKAYKLGAKIIDIPTVWRERTTGKSKFKFLQLLPNYLRWYLYAFKP